MLHPMPYSSPTQARTGGFVAIVCVLAALALGTGCGRIFTGAGVRIRSIDNAAVLEPRMATSGYSYEDASTADIYLSDIPASRLVTADSLDQLSGTIVHLHMFIRPRPGKTPIDTTASTVTIRCAVLTRGEVGVYGGGGFLFPSGTPGDGSFGGAIEHGSVRLLASTPGFADRLGAAELSCGIKVPQDAAVAGVMEHLMEQAVRVARGQTAAKQ